MTTVSSSRVYLDESGTARVNGHKVRMIAVDYLFNKWSPETIHENHPDLSLADIHAALAYYYDNKSAIDAEIEAGEQLVQEMRKEAEASPAYQKLLRKVRAEKAK
jgi:uncharacterized protein (DUF433 family)